MNYSERFKKAGRFAQSYIIGSTVLLLVLLVKMSFFEEHVVTEHHLPTLVTFFANVLPGAGGYIALLNLILSSDEKDRKLEVPRAGQRETSEAS